MGESVMIHHGAEECWRKSSASNPAGNCVEIRRLRSGSVAVRNSRHPDGAALVYASADMALFLRRLKARPGPDGRRPPTAS
ncbi:DUF397 domain-containing protein [Actinocorallia longicatena]|uniref:DUF397 domain-containing protein n=1 Tax=Actinocorallia longicatena TaxID=111803 RepID=A0ABP6Q279_9ACTN